MVHDSQFTVHDSQFTVHNERQRGEGGRQGKRDRQTDREGTQTQEREGGEGELGAREI